MSSVETASRRAWPARLWSVARLLIAASILFYLSRQIVAGWPRVRTVFSQLQWSDGLASLLTAVVAYQCLFLGWLVLLRRLRLYRPRQVAAYARVWWISYFYRYVPGKILIVVERARLGTAVGVPPAIGAALAVVETALAVVAALWVSVLALGFHEVSGRRAIWPAVLISVVTLLLLPLAFGLIRRRPLMRRWFPRLEDTALGPRDLLVVVPIYLIHYVLIGLSFFLCTRSIGGFSWGSSPAPQE